MSCVAGESQIQDLEFTTPGETDVLRLQIPVDHSLDVCEVQRDRQFIYDRKHLVQSDLTAAPNQASQRLTFNEFKNRVRLVLVKSEVVDRSNASMIETGPQLRLSFQDGFQIGNPVISVQHHL